MRPAAPLVVAALSSVASAQSIQSQTPEINALAGGRATLELDAGAAAAGSFYLVLGSVTGDAPGLPLGVGTLPLVPDAYTDLTLASPNSAFLPSSFGALDASGQGATDFVVPALPGLASGSLSVFHAFVLLDGASVTGVSDAAEIVIGQGALVADGELPGSTVATATVDVTGLLPAGFDGTAGDTVDVGGVAAVLSDDPSGFTRFTAFDVRLATGSNTVPLSASIASGADASATLDLTHDRFDANNVVVADGYAYAALAGNGLGVIDLTTRRGERFAAPVGSGSVDDVSIADGLLFVLDAASPGRLSVYSLADPANPVLVDGPVSVPVSPFAGVSAGGGRVVTSGGTSLLRVFEYSADGQLSATSSSADLGIGQPDVLIDPSGDRAYVSTDFAGTVGGATFGITLIDLFTPPTAPVTTAQIGIPGAGFTPGGSSPANFAIESAITGDLLLVASGAGLTLVDLAAQTVGQLDLGISGVGVDATPDRALVVGTGPARSLVTVDISDPAAPVVLGSEAFPAPGGFTGVAAFGDRAVVAGNTGGVFVLTTP